MKSLADYRPYEVVYIDGMNLVSRSYFGMPELSYHGKKTGILFGFVRLALDLRQKNPGIEMIVVWEGADSWRKKKYPIYKAQRHDSKTPEETKEFFDGVEYLKKCLPIIGMRQCHADTYEADDVVATLAPADKRKSLYSSGDWDWWSLVNTGDIYYQHSSIVTREDMNLKFRKKFNSDPVLPDRLWLFKALTGDPSDNISGIPRFPKKLASWVCNTLQVVDGNLSRNISLFLRRVGKDVWGEKLRVNDWLLKRNIDLITMGGVPADAVQWVESDYSVEGFCDILLKNGMETLYDRLKGGAK